MRNFIIAIAIFMFYDAIYFIGNAFLFHGKLHWLMVISINAIFISVFAYLYLVKPRSASIINSSHQQNSVKDRYKQTVDSQKAMILNLLGSDAFYKIQVNGLAGEEVFGELLKDERVLENPLYKYLSLLGMAGYSWKFAEFDSVLQYCRAALETNPFDLIANVESARAYEAKGMAEEAIKSYEAALADNSLSAEISLFLKSEIDRVKIEGPKWAPPYSGLRLLVH